jgi:hypothetical protein
MADDQDEIEELPEFDELMGFVDSDDVDVDVEGDLAFKKPAADVEPDDGEEGPVLRVLDEEDHQKEVVRLGEEEEVKPRDLSRKIKAREDREFLNTMLNEGRMEEELPPSIDLEWLAEDKVVTASTSHVPMGWFILLIGGMAILLAWGAYQLIVAENPKTASQTSSGDSGIWTPSEGPIGKVAEARQRVVAQATYEELEEMLRAYFEAESWEEKLQYVRHPKRVKPLMVDYYLRNKLLPREYESVSEFLVLSLDRRPFTAMRVEFLDGSEAVAVMSETTVEGPKIDWESEVAYQPMEFNELVNSRPSDAMDFRVYVGRDHYFAYEFKDETKWLCFKLTARNSEEYLFGYLPAKSDLAVSFRKLMGSEIDYSRILKPLILRLRFPEGGKGPRSVLIEDVISDRWAYTKDPGEE